MNKFKSSSWIDIITDPENKKEALRVFGDFIKENELAILFGDTNSCKSLLATDISLAVACNWETWEGKTMSELPVGTPVFYYDLEMTEQQVASRYANLEIPTYSLERITFAPTTLGQADLSDLYSDIISRLDGLEDSAVVVIDNMQCFVKNVQNAKEVGSFMDALKNLLSIRKNLTIIVVGHCIKRNMKLPLTQNDLAGSKLIANKADSIIGISESARDPEIRYVKMVKNRSSRRMKEVAELEVTPERYLHLEFTGWGYEEDHLKKSRNGRPGIPDELRVRILGLYSQHRSCRNIADTLGISKSTVNRVILGQI